MYRNIIYNGNKCYSILNVIPVSNFKNSDGNINKRVLGMYVNEVGGNHVLQKQNNILICKEVEEAEIVEENSVEN